MQLIGPTPRPDQAPQAPVNAGVTVDPKLKAISDQLKAREDRRKADMKANRRRDITLSQPGEQTTTELVGNLVEIFRRAFSSEQSVGPSGLAKDVFEGNIREKILEVVGLFPEGLPIIAGELLGALLNAGPLGAGEEAQIAAQELAEAAKKTLPVLQMPPMWLADP